MTLGRALRIGREASLVAAVVAIPVVIWDERTGSGTDLARVVNWALWAVFAVELVLTVAQERWATVRREPLLVLLVVLTIPLSPPGLQAARLLRLVPLLRLLGAVHLARRVFSLDGLRYAGVLLVLVVIGGGLLLPVLEPAQHLSSTDGIWWALVTVTTVGYGDVVPHTDAGRVLGGIVMVTGIGTAALLIGAVAQRFTQTAPDEDRLGEVQRQLAELTDSVEALRRELREKG